MTTISRVCRRCGTDTPFDELAKNKNCTDGADALCKQCDRDLSYEWVAANPERSRAIKAAYKKRDPERAKRQRREYYERHKEQKNAYRRAHYREVRERELEAAKLYRESPKGREVQRTGQKTRRARKHGADGTYNLQDVAGQLKRQRGKCFWCGCKLGKAYHADHVIPLSRGGSNYPSNIVVSCPHCNQSKNDKLPHEWEGSGGRLL